LGILLWLEVLNIKNAKWKIRVLQRHFSKTFISQPNCNIGSYSLRLFPVYGFPTYGQNIGPKAFIASGGSLVSALLY